MSEEAATYLKEWFDRMAPNYDRLEFLLGSVRPRVVEMAAAARGDRVLDVATGTGSQALAFASAGCEATGIDLSEEMIARARSKDGCGRISFLSADASDMPFEDGSFDISVISFALHDMPGPMREKVLKELVRVTTPGGTIMVVDYEIPQDIIHKLFIRFMLSRYENVYVPAYFAYDLEGAIETLGVEIVEKKQILRGVGRILKGRK